MEGNLNMVPGGAVYGGLDMQGSMRFNHHQHQHQAPPPPPPNCLNQQNPSHSHPRQGTTPHPSIHDVFPPLTIGTVQDCDQSISISDFNKGAKNTTSDEDEPSIEDAADGHNETYKGKKGSMWHRMKWTDKMVRFLITAVSYIGEDAASEYGGGGRKKLALLQKKGKWKSVSKVMAERGFYVSPQQCEDKFNDLNKRYKRLNDILGRGTSCQVVEKPALLNAMNHLSEKAKEDVRKILSSKQLFYEEMCSYHNCNRLYLPHDPAIQRSIQLALRNSDDNEINDFQRHSHDNYDDGDDDRDVETNDCDEYEEGHTSHGDNCRKFGMPGGSAKRMKYGHDQEDISLGNPSNSHECNKSNQLHPQTAHIDINQVFPEGSKAIWSQNQWMKSRSLHLEERKIDIEMERLELEKLRLKWQHFSKKKDRALDKLRVENERMKFENESMALELKRKGMVFD